MTTDGRTDTREIQHFFAATRSAIRASLEHRAGDAGSVAGRAEGRRHLGEVGADDAGTAQVSQAAQHRCGLAGVQPPITGV